MDGDGRCFEDRWQWVLNVLLRDRNKLGTFLMHGTNLPKKRLTHHDTCICFIPLVWMLFEGRDNDYHVQYYLPSGQQTDQRTQVLQRQGLLKKCKHNYRHATPLILVLRVLSWSVANIYILGNKDNPTGNLPGVLPHQLQEQQVELYIHISISTSVIWHPNQDKTYSPCCKHSGSNNFHSLPKP